MGWLQLVGSIKLQVSFAKEPYKRDDILQKRPIILSILLTVATPYRIYCIYWYTVAITLTFANFVPSKFASDNPGLNVLRTGVIAESQAHTHTHTYTHTHAHTHIHTCTHTHTHTHTNTHSYTDTHTCKDQYKDQYTQTWFQRAPDWCDCRQTNIHTHTHTHTRTHTQTHTHTHTHTHTRVWGGATTIGLRAERRGLLSKSDMQTWGSFSIVTWQFKESTYCCCAGGNG